MLLEEQQSRNESKILAFTHFSEIFENFPFFENFTFFENFPLF